MLRQVPAEVRLAIEALWQVDAAMGDVVARASQPALAAVRLAWWRDRLIELDHGPPPAEPRLQAVAEHLIPSVTGAELAGLEDGWTTLLEEEVDPARVAGRGSLLFRFASRLLETDDPRIEEAGVLYALVSVGRRGLPKLLNDARPYAQALAGHRFQRPLRPLTALARFAARDLRPGPPFEPEGSPPRLAAMLRHQLTGRI